jgi:hypothetical protein
MKVEPGLNPGSKLAQAQLDLTLNRASKCSGVVSEKHSLATVV